uniref:Ig-like domain-containing protein n=1 Tax=Sparus aurata TaxID=8175 RepID=A0A671TMA7_SPAAU
MRRKGPGGQLQRQSRCISLKSWRFIHMLKMFDPRMFQMTLSGSLNFQFGAFTVLVVLIHSCRGQHHVSCPSEAIVATIGEDIVLPAYLEPAINALRKTIEWTRPDLSPRYVHVQRQGVKLTGNHPSYDGRTSLFSDELKLGNISLKLSRVRISDEGPYRCFLPEMKISCIIQLVVGAASSPDVQMTVVLQCESTGWYPEPEVFWLDGEGNLLSAGPTETVRGPDGLYNVSSRLTVEKRHSNSFTCRVQQNHINQTREAQIHVPGSSPPHPLIIGLICIFVFLLAAPAAVVVLWKWRQNKTRNKKQREDEEGGNSPELKLLMGGDTDGKQPTEETETVNNVDEFRGEPGQTETDEETLQQEANNAQCADSEGTELQFTQEAGGQTTRETETGLDQSQEETETEAVTETDSLHPVSTNLNNKPTETVTMVEERQKDNNQQTADETEAQSLTEEDKHGEQQTAERETLRDREKEHLKKKLKMKEREVEKLDRYIYRYEGQMKDKEKPINEVKQQLEEVKRQTEETLDVKKEDLQEQLDKFEKLQEDIKNKETVARQNNLKATNEKEEIIMKLNELEMQKNQSDPADSLITGLTSVTLRPISTGYVSAALRLRHASGANTFHFSQCVNLHQVRCAAYPLRPSSGSPAPSGTDTQDSYIWRMPECDTAIQLNLAPSRQEVKR